MSRWPTKSLEEVCDINPKATASDSFDGTAKVTFVPMAAVDEVNGTIKRPEQRRYMEVAKGYTFFREDDVLFAKITPCMQNGKAAIARGLLNGKGFGSTEFHVLRPKASMLPDWIFAFIRQPEFRKAAQASFTGSAGQQRVPTEFLKRSLIPVPPLPDQKRIVRLLDAADELRRLRAEADRHTAVLIPALFHAMFGDPFANPKGWEMRPMASFVAELFGGRNVNPAGADEVSEGPRVLKISSVTSGDFRPDESKPIPAGYDPPISHFVREGDLLFSRANTTELVGATAYVFHLQSRLLLPDKLWRFVWKEPRAVEPLFIQCLLQTSSVRRELGKRATGTSGSMKNISKPKLMTLVVPVPPLALQKVFVRKLNHLRELQTQQAASRKDLEGLFQSMLHRAFNGEL